MGGKKQGKGNRIEVGRRIITNITIIHKDFFHCHQHSTNYLSEATCFLPLMSGFT
jgi:hypothetical protein